MLKGTNVKRLGARRFQLKSGMGLLYEYQDDYKLDLIIEFNKELYTLDNYGKVNKLNLRRYVAVVIPAKSGERLSYDYEKNKRVRVMLF